MSTTLTWKDMISTYHFRTPADITDFLENIESDILIILYKDILANLHIYPRAKQLFDAELKERDMREYIRPDDAWIHRGYNNPKDLPDNVLFEVLLAKRGLDLVKRCTGYVTLLPAEALCLAFFYAFCVGREDLLPEAKNYIDKIGTYSSTVKKFLSDHATPEYIKAVQDMTIEIKRKYKI